MRIGRIMVKVAVVPLLIVVAIISGIVFVLSRAGSWIIGPLILFVIACLAFCIFKQEWSRCLPLGIILAGAVGLQFAVGFLEIGLQAARRGLVGFLISY